jgi:hypothetical protein
VKGKKKAEVEDKKAEVEDKKKAEVKDPKAAKRLYDQRQSDDDHMKLLWDLFVPIREGKLEDVYKKYHLGLSTSLFLCLS